MSKKQRDIKIKPNTSDMKKEVDSATTEVEKDPIKLDVEVETTVGFTKFEKFKKGVERKPLELNAEVDLVQPKQQVEAYKHNVESNIVTINHNANTQQANSVMNAYKTNAQQTTYSTHIVTVQTRQAKQKKKDGGLIHPNIPMMKFADGGSPLENGLGHSRKSGKLSGYGGGDKVKALLEAGEFIIKKEAVQKLGLDRLHMLNQGQLPRFKDGGHVTPMQKFNTGGLVKTELNSSGTKGTVNLNLTVGNKTFPMISDEQVAESLASYLQGSEFWKKF